MTRDFLRFVFAEADQALIDASTLVVEDATGLAPAPDVLEAQALTIQGSMLASGVAPRVLPLIPGKLTFVVDPAASGSTPAPADVDPASPDYASWKVEGTLLVSATKAAAEALEDVAGDIELIPNRVWYRRVRITLDFLQDTLVTTLERHTIIATGGGKITSSHADWAKHAIAGFLAGTYEPELRLDPASEAADDVAVSPMPELVVDASGAFVLEIAVAHARKPQDAPDTSFDDLTGAAGLTRNDPKHPRNGRIPARHVYRTLRSKMLGATAGEVVPDTVLADWPNAPRYHLIRCTRTWNTESQNASVHFNDQILRLSEPGGGTAWLEAKVPAHGLVFLPESATAATPATRPTVDAELAGTMTWVDATSVANVWRSPGTTAALILDFEATPVVHLHLRLPMTLALFAEPFDRPGGARCTYMSLRRTARALVDNRITGGRLNYGRGRTAGVTREVIESASATLVNWIRHNQPLPSRDPTTVLPDFEAILNAFFPDPAPQTSAGGTTIYTEGETFYRVWQSVIDAFRFNSTKRNFTDDTIGRGGPGAVAYAGLGAYHVDPVQATGETDNDFITRATNEMLDGTLTPGSPLQFWDSKDVFTEIKARNSPANPVGHSPLFHSYVGTAGAYTAIQVIDQSGITNCPIEVGPPRRIGWGLMGGIDVWIATIWTE